MNKAYFALALCLSISSVACGTSKTASPAAPNVGLPLGTCGVLRRLELNQVPSADHTGLDVTRIGRSFSAAAWASGSGRFAWEALAEDGSSSQTFEFSGEWGLPYVVRPVGESALNGHLVSVAEGADEVGYETDLVARPLDGVQHSAGEPRVALHGFVRGTETILAATSLDGLRVGILNAHPGAFDPRVALLGQDGVRIGDVQQLMQTNNSPSYECPLMLPTAHAVAVGLVDLTNTDGTPVYRFSEFAPSGEIAHAYSFEQPFESSDCPVVTLEADGFALSWLSSNGELALYSLQQGSVREVLRLAAGAVSATPLWASLQQDPPLLLVKNNNLLHVAELRDGALTLRPGELPVPFQWIASEPDRWFAELHDWSDTAPTRASIVEFGCNIAER